MERIAQPLLRAAGLNPAIVNIYIVDDRELNAFVAGGQNIFVHAGLLMRLQTIDQLRAVLAHEIGHIAGGHLARRDQALKGARGIAAIGMLGGALAVAGGAPTAGMALVTGGQQAAMRTALAHSRAEEAAADQAGLRYMAAAGSDPNAILEVLHYFQGQDVLTSSRMDAYARTHPLWYERIALIEDRIARLPAGAGPSSDDTYWHARMVAKFEGFLDGPAQVLRNYPAGDTSEYAALARAVAYHRLPDPARALSSADALVAARPEDPFYHELRGQFLLEAGRAAPAAQSYRQAVALGPDEPLILGGLGRALLNMDDPAADAEARQVLARSALLDKANVGVLRDLALAEARLGNQGAAALATAERHLLEGNFADASRQATRATDLLPEGSPGWRQAQDVLVVTRLARTERP
jgi:predicted Zn-dependent protease